MTIRELIHELVKIKNKDQKVYLATDEEGNGFGELVWIGHEEDGDIMDGPECITLWPSHEVFQPGE